MILLAIAMFVMALGVFVTGASFRAHGAIGPNRRARYARRYSLVREWAKTPLRRYPGRHRRSPGPMSMAIAAMRRMT